VALASGRDLIIAGTLSPLSEERRYFEDEIRPRIDGRQIQFVGPVNDAEKKDLLGSAAALLLPVEWLEPFPVVLPEALLCGTPVLGFPLGGVPEGITEGVTGYVCANTREMVEAVGRLARIDRRRCRAEAERRFSDRVIADEYEALYRELCEQ
jgi:glycosyltransferase involved in cell wall biosynthesis